MWPFKKKTNNKVYVKSVTANKPSDAALKKESDEHYEKNKDEIAIKRKRAREATKNKPKISNSERTRRTAKKDISSFASIGVKRYKVSTCGDSRVCSVCKKHDGKIYNVKNAKAGVNMPPFCDDCRCIILPIFPGF